MQIELNVGDRVSFSSRRVRIGNRRIMFGKVEIVGAVSWSPQSKPKGGGITHERFYYVMYLETPLYTAKGKQLSDGVHHAWLPRSVLT